MLYTGMGIGLVVMLFWTPALMAMGVNKIVTGGELTMGEKIVCWIPLFNIMRAEKLWYSKLFLNFFSFLAVVIFTAFRVYTYVFMRDNTAVCSVSVILFILSWLFAFVANMVFVWSVLSTCNGMGTGKCILFSLLYPFGQFYVGKFLSNVMSYQQKVVSATDGMYDDEEDYGDEGYYEDDGYYEEEDYD